MSILNMLYGSGSGGYAIYDLSLTNDDKNGKVIVKWFEYMPQNWSKTVVRYKTGSAPTSPTDGTLAVQETTKNQYSSTGYSVSGLSDNTTYYFSVFAIDSNNTIIDVQSISITTDFAWNPGANTIGYWTFDDQNINQITDVSGNGNDLTYAEGNKITHSLLSGSDYYGNFNRSRYWKYINGISNYTWCMWCKISQTGQQYIIICDGIDLIYGYNSGQIEVYDYYGGSSYRTTIKSNTPLNTWMLIGFTKNGNTVTTYFNGSKVGTSSFADYQLTGIGLGGTQSQGMIGSLNNVILENKIWSDSDWINYFNRTKSKYGL